MNDSGANTPDILNQVNQKIMFRNITEIKELNKEKGYHFFDRSTKRFFNSRIIAKVYRGHIFLTGETFVDGRGNADPERFTIRFALPDGRIETIGEFNKIHSLERAREMVKALPEYFVPAMLEVFSETGYYLEDAQWRRHLIGDTSEDTYCGAIYYVAKLFKLVKEEE